MRLQKYLARCGKGSRRSCERLINEGRVSLNGNTVEDQGVVVKDGDEVRLDGNKVLPEPTVYYLVNKPEGVICVKKDEKGRRYVVDLIPEGRKRGLFPVGRLDVATRGLIIITNDGDLGNLIAHPRYDVKKTYVATLKGLMDPDLIRSMEDGVVIDNGERVEGIKVVDYQFGKWSTTVTIRIHEGRYHVVRRIFLAKGHRVRDLIRTHIGDLSIGNIGEGEYREVGRNRILDGCGLKEIYSPAVE